MPRFLAIILATFFLHADPAEAEVMASLENGDVVRIDGETYVVIDTKYGPILRRGDTIFVLPWLENSAYKRIEDEIVRVNAQTEDVLHLVRETHLIAS